MENNLIEYDGFRYWINELENSAETERLICDHYEEGYNQGNYYRYIDNGMGEKLNFICKNNKVLIYSFLVAAMKINLSKYMTRECITIGIPFYNGKNSRKIASSKVLPLTSNIDYEESYKEYMIRIKNKISEVYKNQDYLNTSVLLGYKDCKDIMELTPISICMKNFHEDKYINYIVNSSKNEISFLFELLGDKSIKLNVLYNMNKISENTIKNVSRTFVKVLDDVLDNYNKKIKDIDILSEHEKNRILYEFNDSKMIYDNTKTIQELFEDQVEKTPNNIAVVFEGEKLTYRELNEKSNQLARVLRSNGVKADSIVAIMVDRSLEMIISIIGILKAGGAYLPIDSSLPKERIEYIMSDSKCEILLSEQKLVEELVGKWKLIDLYEKHLFEGQNTNLEKINESSSLAYVIYTSGTTGNPKGVMIEHRNLNNLILGLNNNIYKKYTKYLNICLVAPYYFDASVQQIFGSILNGHSLYITDNYTRRDIEKLFEYYEKNNIDISDGTPMHIKMMVSSGVLKRTNVKIDEYIIGGEELPLNTIREFYKSLKGENKPYINNVYGPTECCVDSSIYLVEPKEINNIELMPIGKPMVNYKLYILGKHNELLPIGVPGELCISGDGVARGYLNNSQLTEAKFVDNPFESGTKMYKTGDLARWLEDGNVQFLGRIDNQVKIRGFRIELGEIENKLLLHKDVKEATVLVAESDEGDKYICAYIICDKEINDLREYLKESLPEYMIPSCFIRLDKMPITSNGKIDRKALPKPSLGESLVSYEAPTNDLEKTLAIIWSEVLGIDKIGINDNFFQLGGHSLKAMSLISKIHKETSKEVPLKELFKSPTIKGLSKFIEETEESIYSKIEKVEEREYYEASSAQKRVYIIQGLDKENIAYNMPQIFEIQGSMDREKVEDTFRKLFDRHEALRTYFKVLDGEIVQRIDESCKFNLENRVESGSIEDAIDDFIKPFDLSKAPLFRATVVDTLEKKYLLIDMHHIISDGVSMSILINEFATLYNCENVEIPKLQYKDFAAWQNNFLKSEKMKKQEEYWINVFNDEIPVLNMPIDYERPAVQSFEGDSVNFEVDENVSAGLRELTKKTGTTMHMVLLSAFNILLSKYSGQEDIVVGTPVAGRPHADLQNIMGMFVNTLALRNKPQGDKKYLDFLKEVKENSLKAYENQSYQLETLIEKLDIVRDTSRNPIFDVMFNMVDTVVDLDIKLNNMALIPYGKENNVAKFDLTLNAIDQNDEINISIGYCSKLFNKNSIERLGKYYLAILESITTNAEIKLGEIELLSNKEKNLILNKFNDNRAEYASDKTIQELFEAQVEKTPDNIAVVFEDKRITYKELNEKSNQLARALRDKGVSSDSVVAIMLDRSVEMLISIIAILKAGGAYLPIDPTIPKERIDYILVNSESKILLSNEELIKELDTKCDFIDLYNKSIFSGEKNNLNKINDSSSLAYVIYTSGTTGNPKGVMIEHRSLNNLTLGLNKKVYDKYNRYLNICLVAPYYFDASVQQIFAAILNGHSLYITDDYTRRDANKLIKYYEEHNIDISDGTPVHLKMAASSDLLKIANLKVKEYIIGGEELPLNTVKEFYSNLVGENKPIINNVYGPTECCVDSSIYTISYDIISKIKFIPIGEPMVNYKLYILDKYNKVLPIGVPGELFIGGDGLARGYLNRSELTVEKFVDNPFELGTKMYRTGDLARWLPNGNIEFLGRIDNQVKIRGFRIELGEIESRVLQHENVREATVIVMDGKDEDKQICSYIVSDKDVSELNLRDYLKESLPEYMIPSYFVKLERMPITSNGKLDRRSLPKPNLVERLTSYEAPRNELEETLVKIWSEVLGGEKIGINDSFFELGGHSLKAMALISKIHKETNKELPLKDLFKSPTIKGISRLIEDAEDSIYSKIEKVEEREYYEASSAQKRMYVIQDFDKESVAYNMPQIFEVQGCIDKAKIEDTFKKLIYRHEALRTYFENVEDEIVQKIDNDYEFNLKYKVSYQDIKEIANDFIKPFDLGKAPLFRVEVVETQTQNYLLIDMHHIISDGVSMGILINEFANLYNGEGLEPLKLQYKDFAQWQNNLLKSQEMKKQEDYWINIFNDEIPVLNMPIDYERSAVQSFEGDSISFEIDENMSSDLREFTQKTGTTMHMVLLSALNILLSKYSGQEDIVVGIPVAGRPHVDLQNIIGMFVNTLALRNKPEGTKKYIDFLNEVKENSLKAYDNQSYQLEALIEKLDIVRDTSRNPLFDIMFNMVDTVSNSDIKLNDMVLIPQGNENNVAKFDLTLNAMYLNEKLSLSIQYCSKLFDKTTIERLGNHYIKVLEKVINDYEIELGNIDLLLDQERKQILYDFNDTQVDYVNNSTIQQMFESQVEKTPNNIAVVFEDKSLTYKELNERSNSLAMLLRNKGVKPNSIVAIMVERSLDMAIGIMGILKSGAAYLPIDPTYPKQRIEYMLEDSESKLLLSKDKLVDKLQFTGEIIDLSKKDLFIGNIKNSEKLNSSSDLAYVIYTSGTTGKPKGVLIRHQSLTETLLWRKEEYRLSEKHVILPIFNYVFDGFVINFFTPLISGSKVVLVNNYEMSDTYKLVNYIRTLGVTHYISVPSIYSAILSIVNKSDLDTLKVVTLAGEKMPPRVVEYTKKLNPNIEIVNEYGPTENTVVTTIMRNVQSDKKISIGKPIANTKVYILNSSNKIQPIGVPGEVFIGGSRLAKGYLNRPELDAERFIESFYDEGEKLYRTGDIARWLSDGSIDFIDRIDNQVKIRGFRIELGEIENILSYHDDVKEATVLVIENEDNEKCICAYVVGEKEIDTLGLKNYLKENLPAYMIPSYFVQLEKMPITPNGKIDRKILPKPKLDELTTSYEAPRNEVEKVLVEIWKNILNIKQVGINDNFFEIGGYSLKATKLISRINKEFNVEISIKDVFHSQTIKELSHIINESKKCSMNVSNDDVILLKSSDENSSEREENLFIIHDGSGEIGGYIELASNLKDNIKCWAIKADKDVIYNYNTLTIEDLSEKYINIIKNIQPNGSYNIAGWSLGGVIAFEMVRQLEKNSNEIKNLFLIDSYINPKMINYNKVLKEDVSLDTEKKNLISYIKNNHIKEKIYIESTLDKKWNVAKETLSKEDLEEIKLSLPKEFTNIIPNIGELNLDELLNSVNIVRRLTSALKSYKPKNKVKTHAILYKAKQESKLNVDKWNKYFDNSLVIDEVEGNHYTIISKGNVEYIAEKFNKFL